MITEVIVTIGGIMKVIYASRTGNVESIVNTIGLDAIDINTISAAEEDYILFTYTDGAGDIPYEVETFLAEGNNASLLKGVIASGDPMYGEENFCASGDKIAAMYGVPCLYKVLNEGTDEDYAQIAELVK